MKIVSANLQMQSQHLSLEKQTRRESLRMWMGDPPPNRGRTAPPANPTPGTPPEVALSNAARAGRPVRQQLDEAAMEEELSPTEELKVSILRMLVEKFTSTKLELFSPKELKQRLEEAEQNAEAATPTAAPAEQTPAGFGMEYDYYESRYEYEKTTFNAEGTIVTADGKQIQFNVALSMSREFFSEQQISIRAGEERRLKDPLVINFGGSAAELTQTSFNFDLDADGREDQIAFVSPNSGFLALDKNGDGRINDGNELFGPTSGNGFSELSAYDEDNNQFIDENDAIYHQLRIWSRDAAGNDILMGLGDRNVGAIYLGHLQTPFSLKDSDNNLQGQVQSTGIYLKEDGGASTIQHVDLAI